MARFIIEGGHRIEGQLTVSGNKNAALPMLAASLLTTDEVELGNLPNIIDVGVMLDMLDSLGVTVARKGARVSLRSPQKLPEVPDPVRCRMLRGSILLAGPLLARNRRLLLSPPGGDVIGRRRLDTHFHGLMALGVHVEWTAQGYLLERGELRGADILLDEASVTATENILMAAVMAKGQTVIYNAACEPHVQDLCALLIAMGAQIEGVGTNRLIVRGVKKLHGAKHRLDGDFMEAASYLAAAAATGGAMTVRGIRQRDVALVVHRAFERLGAPWSVKNGAWILPRPGRLRVSTDLHHAIGKIEDGIWPAFPSDLMSVMIVLATQAAGTVLFFEKLFESRMYFVDRLIEMGAPIVQCDPHRVVVNGPAPLRASLLTSPDIRAGMALIIAALCAKGTSTIENAQMVDRGYEQVDVRLRSLGARITREET